MNLFNLDDYTVNQEETSGVISSNNHVGDISELTFVLEAKKRGYDVFSPFGHSTKADLVIRKPSCKCLTIQVKTGTYQKPKMSHHLERWKFMVGSGRPSCAANPNDYGLRYKKYKRGDFDVLAAFIPEREVFSFYLLDDIVGKSSITWTVGNQEWNWNDLDLVK